MTLESRLKSHLSQAFQTLFDTTLPPDALEIQPTRADFEGSHTFVTFPYTKAIRKAPPEIGNLLGNYLQTHSGLVHTFNVVQGFLNLTLVDAVWLQLFQEMQTSTNYGFQPANGETVMVEYSSPNTNKPLHLGHLRNNFLGASVAEILKANGYHVVKTNIVNDRGIHICKSMLAYQKLGNGETPESSGLKGDHLVGKYYVAFDKEYKAETEVILEKIKNKDFQNFTNEEQNKLNVHLQNINNYETQLKNIISENQELVRHIDVLLYANSFQLAASPIEFMDNTSLKKVLKEFEDLEKEENNSTKEFRKLIKTKFIPLEEKIEIEEEAIKDIAQSKAPMIQQAQAMLLKWEQHDPETVALWKKMNGWVYAGFDATYRRMGVGFDKFYYESGTYLLGKEIVQDGLEKGIFFTKDNGSVWVDLTADGLDQKLLLRSDGTSVYITQDLGLADLKFQDFPMQKSVYVVGNEQDYHFKVLFLILKKLDRAYAEGLFHLSYGMVDLPSGRMKSREGTVVDADDLMEEMVETARSRSLELSKVEDFPEAEQQALFESIGIGALKYFLLKVDPAKRMVFNPEESIDLHGNTATFIQFNHARTQAILRKSRELSLPGFGENYVLHQAEQQVIVKLAEFPEVLRKAGQNYAPYLVANYTYELTKEYSRFYTELSIFQADTPEQVSFRVALSEETGKVIRSGMRLLGVSVPDRM